MGIMADACRRWLDRQDENNPARTRRDAIIANIEAYSKASGAEKARARKAMDAAAFLARYDARLGAALQKAGRAKR